MVTMPDADDWQLLGCSESANKAVVDELNCVLSDILAAANNGGFSPWQVTVELFPRIELLDNKYPEFGILDTEARVAMARFFSENYDHETYEYVRWWQKDPF